MDPLEGTLSSKWTEESELETEYTEEADEDGPFT